MSIYTNDPLLLAFLQATGMSVPSGARAMKEFIGSAAYQDKFVVCKECAHPHLDYLNVEECVSCGCGLGDCE